MQHSQNQFLKMARDSFARNRENQAELDEQRKKNLKNLISPMSDSLDKFKRQVEDLEKSRLHDRSTLQEQMRGISDQLLASKKATEKLSFALQARPQVRGRWAEEQLQNILELAGMSKYADFSTQVTEKTADRTRRPDAILRLPGGGKIVIDAKISLDAFLDAAKSENESERKSHLIRHARHLREHMKGLSAKSYWSLFKESPDFVVMFIPGDHFYVAASEYDPQLFQDAIESRVVVATPSTLVALAKAVSLAWRQEMATQAAQQLIEIGRELYERMANFGDHMGKVGHSLDRGVKAYNDAVGSLESRVMPAARKLKDTAEFETVKELEELSPVERHSREIKKLPEGKDEAMLEATDHPGSKKTNGVKTNKLKSNNIKKPAKIPSKTTAPPTVKETSPVQTAS